MSYYTPKYEEDELVTLLKSCSETLICAERHGDKILLFKIKELMDIINARLR